MQLIPMQANHVQGLMDACLDGKLWELYYTATPHYAKMNEYVALALQQKALGQRVPFTVIDLQQNRIVGTTSFRDFDWNKLLHSKLHFHFL